MQQLHLQSCSRCPQATPPSLDSSLVEMSPPARGRLTTWRPGAGKTVEMVLDFGMGPPHPHGDTAERFCSLGTDIIQVLNVGAEPELPRRESQASDVLSVPVGKLKPAKHNDDAALCRRHHRHSPFSPLLSPSGTLPPLAKRRDRLQHCAEKVTGYNLPSLQDLNASRTLWRAGGSNRRNISYILYTVN